MSVREDRFLIDSYTEKCRGMTKAQFVLAVPPDEAMKLAQALTREKIRKARSAPLAVRP
jgi:hypothetical protein